MAPVQMSDERLAGAKEHKRIAKLVEIMEKCEDDRIRNLVLEHAPTEATPLQQWHTLTRSRQWAGRVQRLSHLLGEMGLADFQSLKEAFLKEPLPVVSSCVATIPPPPLPAAAQCQETARLASGPRVQRRVKVGTKRGVVIGKGGENIAMVQRESGARIQMNKSTGTVTISGSEAQVVKANYLIAALIRPPEPRAPVHQQPSLVVNSSVHGSAEICSIAKQLDSDERKCCNRVLEMAKRRLLVVLAELEREVPVATADSSVVVHYRERRRQLDRERTEARRQRDEEQATGRHTIHVSCSSAAVGTIVGKKGVNLKRIGAEFGCKIVFNPSRQCFELKSVDPEALQHGKTALLNLEAKFNRDQAHWATEKEHRQTEYHHRQQLSVFWQEQKLVFPELDSWKDGASSLWHRHQRGKRKAANQHRQQIKIDSTRRSTAQGGRWSRPLKLDKGSSSGRRMKRLVRTQKMKPAHRADSQAQVQTEVFDWTCPMKAL